MESGGLIDLIQRCSETGMWGHLKLNFQNGKITTVDVVQSLKTEVCEIEEKQFIVFSPIQR